MPGGLLAVNYGGNCVNFAGSRASENTNYFADNKRFRRLPGYCNGPYNPGISANLYRIFDNFLLTTEVNSPRMQV